MVDGRAEQLVVWRVGWLAQHSAVLMAVSMAGERVSSMAVS